MFQPPTGRPGFHAHTAYLGNSVDLLRAVQPIFNPFTRYNQPKLFFNYFSHLVTFCYQLKLYIPLRFSHERAFNNRLAHEVFARKYFTMTLDVTGNELDVQSLQHAQPHSTIAAGTLTAASCAHLTCLPDPTARTVSNLTSSNTYL